MQRKHVTLIIIAVFIGGFLLVVAFPSVQRNLAFKYCERQRYLFEEKSGVGKYYPTDKHYQNISNKADESFVSCLRLWGLSVHRGPSVFYPIPSPKNLNEASSSAAQVPSQ